jgi:hypothetical protein
VRPAFHQALAPASTGDRRAHPRAAPTSRPRCASSSPTRNAARNTAIGLLDRHAVARLVSRRFYAS